MSTTPAAVLHHLERHRLAPRGEVALDLEAAATVGAADPVPVLLLTDAALYAYRSGAGTWDRLPLARLGRVTITVDPSGILTRYQVVEDTGAAWLDLAVAFARPSFRQRLRRAATRLTERESARLALLRGRREAHVAVVLRLVA